MAWLEILSTGVYQVGFRYARCKWKRSINTTNPQIAERTRHRLEENLRLVEEGRLDIPEGADVPEFLLYDGKLSFANPHPKTRVGNARAPSDLGRGAELQAHSSIERLPADADSIDVCTPADRQAAVPNGKPSVLAGVPLSRVFDEYLAKLPENALGPETLRVAKIHFAHLKRVLGADTPIVQIDKQHLQDYVTERGKSTGKRGKPLSATTVKKELGTFSSVWTWAKDNKHVTVEFPGKKLKYAPTSDKPPFQTIAEVERKISLGHLSPDEQDDLWDSVFLTLPEIDELLKHVRRRALHPFLYPMFAFAAHTGARRSEMRRSQIHDIDFEGKRIDIRERKRVQGKHTLRSVPMSPLLESVLRKWLAKHPGGKYTFCLGAIVPKSSKSRRQPIPLTCEEAGHHFQQVLRGTKWQRLRGWHALRHSFCSNCAAQGVDQRMINSWVGHQTESSMVRRYRHLIPSQEQAAISTVFAPLIHSSRLSRDG